MGDFNQLIKGFQILAKNLDGKREWVSAEHDVIYAPGPPPPTYEHWDDEAEKDVEVPIELDKYSTWKSHMPDEDVRALAECSFYWDTEVESWRFFT